MHKLVVANFKMNGSVDFYKSYAKKIKNVKVKDTKIALCPPFVYLPFFKINNKNISIGAQDISKETNTKNTGEISADMIKEFNAKYVIIGHSERRAIGETDELIATKVAYALENGLLPIVCVGEEEKTSSISVIEKQVKAVLSVCKPKTEIVFAYEPVWAIGTGEVPTSKQIDKVVKKIKRLIKKADMVPICLYGGSVNEKNFKELLSAEIDGFLLGGVSLKADKFIEIVKGVENE